MVFSPRVPRKGRFSGAGKLLRYTEPGSTAPKFSGFPSSIDLHVLDSWRHVETVSLVSLCSRSVRQS
jgi:hypothetical protein